MGYHPTPPLQVLGSDPFPSEIRRTKQTNRKSFRGDLLPSVSPDPSDHLPSHPPPCPTLVPRPTPPYGRDFSRVEDPMTLSYKSLGTVVVVQSDRESMCVCVSV